MRPADLRNHAAVLQRIRQVTASVYSRAIRKAAELLGGRERLAKVLVVPVPELDRWIADEARPPRDIFLRVVDIVLDEGAANGTSEASDPAPPRDCAGSPGTEPGLL